MEVGVALHEKVEMNGCGTAAAEQGPELPSTFTQSEAVPTIVESTPAVVVRRPDMLLNLNVPVPLVANSMPALVSEPSTEIFGLTPVTPPAIRRLFAFAVPATRRRTPGPFPSPTLA